MITTLLILALLLALLGVIGSIAPILPWPLLGLIGLLIVFFATDLDISTQFVIWMTLLTIVTMLADYYLPILGTKKYGGSKEGVRGSTIGLIVWIFVLPPRGLIIFPFIWAYLGEYLVKKDSKHARRAAWGSFLGSVGSTVLKLIVSGIILWKLIIIAFQYR